MALPCLEALLLYFVLLGVLSYLSLSLSTLWVPREITLINISHFRGIAANIQGEDNLQDLLLSSNQTII